MHPSRWLLTIRTNGKTLQSQVNASRFFPNFGIVKTSRLHQYYASSQRSRTCHPPPPHVGPARTLCRPLLNPINARGRSRRKTPQTTTRNKAGKIPNRENSEGAPKRGAYETLPARNTRIRQSGTLRQMRRMLSNPRRARIVLILRARLRSVVSETLGVFASPFRP